MNRLSLRNNRLKSKTAGKLPIILEEFIDYRRFIAGPTLNNSKKKEGDFFWKLSLNVVEDVAKVEILFIIIF